MVWQSPELQTWTDLYSQLGDARDSLVQTAELKVDTPKEPPTGTEQTETTPGHRGLGPTHTDDSLAHQILRTEFNHSCIAVKSERRSYDQWKLFRLVVGGVAVLAILFLVVRILVNLADGTFDPIMWNEGIILLGAIFTGAMAVLVNNGVKDAYESYKVALGMNKELFDRIEKHEKEFQDSVR